jgi:hypothetical protein
MFYHHIYITYTIKVGFTRWINNYNEQQINTVSHKVIDNINQSIINNRKKTNFIPYKNINISDNERDKFISEHLEIIVNIINQQYSYNNHNIHVLLELDFNTNKEIIDYNDIEFLIFENFNQTYSDENNSVDLYVGNNDIEHSNYYYNLKILDVPEDIHFTTINFINLLIDN